MKRSLYMLVAALMTVASLQAQDSQAIAERIDRQRYEFPQEKIHVMTDRGSYLAGDSIKLRAWVVDAATHQPVDASKFVYFELLAPTDSVCSRVKIHQDDDGVFQGYLPIPVELPEGRYQLTAYTMFMQSVGTDYFYRQPIEVAGLGSLQRRIVARCVRFDKEVDVTLRFMDLTDNQCTYSVYAYMSHDGFWNQRGGGTGEAHFTLKGKDANMPVVLVAFDDYFKYIPLAESQDVAVDFYPEGGYLVLGVDNTLAFKMYDPGGLTVNNTGELVDDQGTVVAPLRVEHDGMGVVSFKPRPDGRYTARWRNNFDEYVAFDLPLVRPEASVVQVKRGLDGQVTVRAVGAKAADALLMLQQRGRLLAVSHDSITVNESDLSPGVVQALLLDEKWRCLSERLFFAGQDALPETHVATDRMAYGDREPVKVSVDISSLPPGFDGGDCAVAVIDGRATVASEGNIFANLLLQSDLHGRVHAPEYYFEQGDSVDVQQRGRHLDMLMLTQGWRRYDIPRVLKGLLAEPQYPIEVSQVVAGRVLSDWRKKPVAGAAVSMIVPRMGFSAVTTADSLGRFSIAIPLMPDSVDCIILAENEKGKKQMNLELAAESFPKTFYQVDSGTASGTSASVQDEQAWRLASEGDWRHIMLSELIVTARPRRFNIPTESSYMLTADDIARLGINSVEAAIRALPGLSSVGGGVFTVGGRAVDRVSIYVDGEPISGLYSTDTDAIMDMLDTGNTNSKLSRMSFASFYTGSDYDLSDISIADGMVAMSEVRSVRFVRGTHGGGMLFIDHKPSYNGTWKEPSMYLKIAHPMGAQRPVEFYSPRYDEGDCGIDKGMDLRSVLYWNPCVKLDADGKAAFDFYSSDVRNSTYTILVEGVTSDGTLIRATHDINKQ